MKTFGWSYVIDYYIDALMSLVAPLGNLNNIIIISFFIACLSLGAIYFKLHSSGKYTKDEYTNFRYFWPSVVSEYKKHTKKDQNKDIWIYYLFITSLMISVVSFTILAIKEIPKLVR